MELFLGILAAPKRSFQNIQVEPVWHTAVIMIIVGFFILVWLGGCWTDLSRALEWTNLLGPALTSPLIVGIVSLGTTALIYLLNLILKDSDAKSARFKTLYSVNIHCGMIFLLGEVVNFLLLRASILGDQPTPLRGRFPVGFDILLLGVDDPNLYLSIILHSTSVFLIWYLVVLSFGIHVVTGTSKAKAAAIVATLWCAVVLLVLGVAYAAGGDTTVHVRL